MLPCGLTLLNFGRSEQAIRGGVHRHAQSYAVGFSRYSWRNSFSMVYSLQCCIKILTKKQVSDRFCDWYSDQLNNKITVEGFAVKPATDVSSTAVLYCKYLHRRRRLLLLKFGCQLSSGSIKRSLYFVPLQISFIPPFRYQRYQVKSLYSPPLMRIFKNIPTAIGNRWRSNINQCASVLSLHQKIKTTNFMDSCLHWGENKGEVFKQFAFSSRMGMNSLSPQVNSVSIS